MGSIRSADIVRLLASWFLSFLALLLTAELLPGFDFTSWTPLLLAAAVTGVAISKTGKFRWAVWGGWGLTALGVAFLCAIDSETQLTQVILTDLIVGVGLGM